jgi:hypothetical protein
MRSFRREVFGRPFLILDTRASLNKSQRNKREELMAGRRATEGLLRKRNDRAADGMIPQMG